MELVCLYALHFSSQCELKASDYPFGGETCMLQMKILKMYLLNLQEADSDPTGESAVKTQQLLTYYELDLGLNHVVRKYSEQLEEHANFLISGRLATIFF